MLDIKNPDHVAALRWACEYISDVTAGKPRIIRYGTGSFRTIKDEALDALSSPASAAELIRQLVERGGPEAAREACGPSGIGAVLYCCLVTGHGGGCWRSWPDDDASKIIARLLALAPKAGAEAVLRALRGAS